MKCPKCRTKMDSKYICYECNYDTQNRVQYLWYGIICAIVWFIVGHLRPLFIGAIYYTAYHAIYVTGMPVLEPLEICSIVISIMSFIIFGVVTFISRVEDGDWDVMYMMVRWVFQIKEE